MSMNQEQPNSNSAQSLNRTSAPLGSEPQTNGGAHKSRILFGIGVLALLGAGVLGYWFFFMRGIVFTDDARISGHLVDLAPEINGKLVEVLVQEGQSVRCGEDIFRLDEETARATLNQAEAALASAKASAAASEAMYQRALNGSRPEEIKAAEATVNRLQIEETLAQLELSRVQELRKSDAAPQDRLDRAKTAYESAHENRANAVQTLVLLQQGPRKEDIEAAKAGFDLARARVGEAAAALDRARKDLSRCVVKAPFAAWVVRRWLDPGAMLMPGQPVVSLFDPATMRVDANIEEKYLSDVQIGDHVDVTVDAFPELHLDGRVREILRATNSKFSLIPAEGVAGTFIKVVQRVPLRISITAPPNLPLGPGLSVEVHIRSGSADKKRP